MESKFEDELIKKAEYLFSNPQEVQKIDNEEEREALVQFLTNELDSSWSISDLTYEEAKQEYPEEEFRLSPSIRDQIFGNIYSDQLSLEVLFFIENMNSKEITNLLVRYFQTWDNERIAAACNIFEKKHDDSFTRDPEFRSPAEDIAIRLRNNLRNKVFLNYLDKLYEDISAVFSDLFIAMKHDHLKTLMEGLFFNHFIMKYDFGRNGEKFLLDRSWCEKIKTLKKNINFQEFVLKIEEEYLYYLAEFHVGDLGDINTKMDYIDLLGIVGSNEYKKFYRSNPHYVIPKLSSLGDNKSNIVITYEDTILIKFYDKEFTDNYIKHQQQCREEAVRKFDEKAKEYRKNNQAFFNWNKFNKSLEDKETSIDIFNIQKSISTEFNLIREKLKQSLLIEKKDEEKQIHDATEMMAKVVLTQIPKVTKSVNIEDSIKFLKEKFNTRGANLWEKLDIKSQKYLVTGEVQYQALKDFSEDLDFSGACVMFTKALERELNIHFYKKLLNYCRATFEDEYNKWPRSITVGKNPKPTTIFTLGKIENILDYNYTIVVTAIATNHIRINNEYKKNICQTLSLIKGRCITITNEYRNRAAHDGHISLGRMNDCRELMIITEQFLIELMEIFS